MKHIIILGDGMADWPAESLGNKTLLQYSSTPYMDKLGCYGTYREADYCCTGVSSG